MRRLQRTETTWHSVYAFKTNWRRETVETICRILLVWLLSGCALSDGEQLHSSQQANLVPGSTVKTKVVEVAFLLQDSQTGFRQLMLSTINGLERGFPVSTSNEVGAPSWRPGWDQFAYCEYEGLRCVLKIYDISDHSSKTILDDGRFNEHLPRWPVDLVQDALDLCPLGRRCKHQERIGILVHANTEILVRPVSNRRAHKA